MPESLQIETIAKFCKTVILTEFQVLNPAFSIDWLMFTFMQNRYPLLHWLRFAF